ncbi:MAG: hemolysin III family protein, partial [Pseudoflavonifractor sp.]
MDKNSIKKHSTERQRDPYDGLRPWSAMTHGVGVVLGILGTVLLLLRAVSRGSDAWHIVSFSIYGASMIGLYTASTLYHCLRTSVPMRVALKKYDHASIYFLIAGSYTPICLVGLRMQGGWGWALFGIIWGLALAGLVLTLVWIHCPRWM